MGNTKLKIDKHSGSPDPVMSRVREFHEVFSCHSPAAPEIPVLSPMARRKMEDVSRLLRQASTLAHVYAENHRHEPGGVLFTRVQLLAEELQELVEKGLLEGDIVEALDALGDLDYVVSGTYITLGLSHLRLAAVAEIHSSNMTKLGPDGRPIINQAGRVVKGPSYRPPNLAPLLDTPK